MTTTPTIVTTPCFSGAPWDLDQLTPLADHPLRTMRLPDGLADIEDYADFVTAQVADLDDYVLVGDSFGAIVALAVATRRPQGPRALVLSGGFATNPVDNPVVRAKIAAARYLPGPLYRQVVLRPARRLARVPPRHRGPDQLDPRRQPPAVRRAHPPPQLRPARRRGLRRRLP